MEAKLEKTKFSCNCGNAYNYLRDSLRKV